MDDRSSGSAAGLGGSIVCERADWYCRNSSSVGTLERSSAMLLIRIDTALDQFLPQAISGIRHSRPAGASACGRRRCGRVGQRSSRRRWRWRCIAGAGAFLHVLGGNRACLAFLLNALWAIARFREIFPTVTIPFIGADGRAALTPQQARDKLGFCRDELLVFRRQQPIADNAGSVVMDCRLLGAQSLVLDPAF